MANDALRQARLRAGYQTAADAARALGIPEPTYVSHENGTRGLRMNAARRYAALFKVDVMELFADQDEIEIELSNGDTAVIGLPGRPRRPAPPRSSFRTPIAPGRVPIFGFAAAGDDGRFIMNGDRIGETFRPPALENVKDAYAVYVHGTSMVPRYEAGEAVWVNPHIPVRRDDYAVVQIAGAEGDPLSGFVKRFVSHTADELILWQFNPAKELRFDAPQVQSVHKIVLSGMA